MRWLLILVALLASPVAHAACAAPLSSAAILADVDRATAAYTQADVDGFYRATNAVREAIPCLGAAVDRTAAIRIHVLLGARAFVERDEAGATASFAAAKALDPSLTWPTDLAPLAHPMAALFAATVPDPAAIALAAPSAGALYFDGLAASVRPDKRATIAQHIDAGVTLRGAYLRPGDAMFDYPVPEPKARRKSTGWWVAAASSAAVSGGLYGLAAASANGYPTADYADEAAIRGRTNGLVVASAGVGVIAVGTTVGALLSGTW